MKKRILALTLVLIMTLCLFAGCAADEKEEAPADTGKDNAATEDKKEEAATGSDAWDEYDLRFGINLPEEHVGTQSVYAFAEAVDAATDGKVKITVYPGEALGKESEMVAMCMEGSLDITTCGPGTLANYGNADKLSMMEAPYVFEDADNLLAFANSEDGNKYLWDPLSEASNLRVVATSYYGARNVTTNGFNATTPADLEGCKLRVPDSTMALLYGEGLGATPTVMALSEVYLGLQQGTVDGQENPLPTIYSYAFYEVCDYLLLTGHVQAGLSLMFNQDLWDSFPADLQEVILDCLNTEFVIGMKDGIIAQEEQLMTDLADLGMTLVEVDKEAFKENCQFIYDQYAEKWGDMKDVAASYAG